jgi:RsiW-degrading membrane proteinase PrsW (M82 family)
MLMLLSAALAPVVAIIAFIYWKDTHDKEPVGLLIKAFFMGIGAVVVTLIVSIIIGQFFVYRPDVVFDMFIHAFFGVSMVEEISKFIFIAGILYRSKHFDEPYDGIMYSIMVGMGFAGFENVLYVMDGGMGTALTRALTAVPGLQKFKPNPKHPYMLYGLIGAILLHGFYDFFLFISFIPGVWIGAVFSLVTGLILTFRAIRLHRAVKPFYREDRNQ